jgi:hypothetical protein
LELTCRAEEGCHASAVLEPWMRLTKMGTFRLEGSAKGWYVDGFQALCPKHLPDPMPRPQRETWSEYDRLAVEAEEAMS